MQASVGTSIALFGMHRGGSSIVGRLLQVVLGGAGYRLIDEGKRYYQAGYVLDDVPQHFFANLDPQGVFYGPFRSYPSTMRLADLSAITKVLVVRDPRDCLVSSYYAQRGPHDRADLRRATTRLPTQLDCEDAIDDFCIRNADAVRSHLDSMRLLCLHYPHMLLYRYEDIFADTSGWLDAVVAHLDVRPPTEALDQARVEAVLDTVDENPARHHRQGRPGDHHRKLSRQTEVYLAEFLASQLAFFAYGGNIVRPPDWGRGTVAVAATAAQGTVGESADVATLKRMVHALQRENSFRIDEIVALRRSLASLHEPETVAA